MNVQQMTRKDFEALPERDWQEDIGEFDCLIILPATRATQLHDSGYRYIDYVAVRNNEAVCRLDSGSDVLHLDGIGGHGYKWLERYGTVPATVPPSGWRIDCLKKSGLLRIWPNSGRMVCGDALSSFELYALPKQKKQEK